MAKITERIKRGYNAFMGRDPTFDYPSGDFVYGSSYRPDRLFLSTNSYRSIIGAIYNQIAVDVSSVTINHVRLDEDGNFESVIDDSLNRALTLDPNIDQTGRGLIRDIVISMFDEGVVAVVPVETDVDPRYTDSYKIYKLRVGKILEWFPAHVRVRVYDELTGTYRELMTEKRTTAIIENPFYSIMNETNSTSSRLNRVLNQIDQLNNQLTSGKLDMIIQLPYAIKNDTKRAFANERRKDLESQLAGSQLGIGYIDATEKVIQLNRSLDNNLWQQAQDLLVQLYNQLGFSQSIFDGTADEQTMINYNNRTIEPTLAEITQQMQKKWISKTAETQRQAIRFYRDPFKLVPVGSLAEMSDKLIRNEIMSSNEVRTKLGMKPSDDPKADKLQNPNLNHPDEKVEVKRTSEEVIEDVQ